MRELAILGFVSFTATVLMQFVPLSEEANEFFECLPMWRTRRLRLRPAGAPEASFSATPSSRLPRAPASLGQSAAGCTLAGHTGLGATGSDGTLTLTLSLTLNPNPNQVYWLRWLPPKKSELLYHLAMTGSNVLAVACVGVWVVHAQAHLATRFFAAAAIAVLVFLRQKESNEHCRVSRWRSPLLPLTLPHSDDTRPFE